jgi:parvulin-like peptidyl-prolyl isomerase
VSTERRGASARAEAERLLARLREAGARAKTDALGDPSMLPRELPQGPLSEVARAFGTDFAAKVDAIAPGQWAGPVESPYGLHLVLTSDRVAATRPVLADVRPVVEREYLAERRRAQLQALYERLLQKYTVSIEMPREDARKQAAAGKPGDPGR